MSGEHPQHDLDAVLAQDARVRRLSRMVPPTGPLSERAREEILIAVRTYMAQQQLSQGDLAKAVGANKTYISNLFSGTGNLPTESRDEVLRNLNNWLEREARARHQQRDARFVPTSVARKIIAIAESLLERPDMALVSGPAGIGKSMTADAICAE